MHLPGDEPLAMFDRGNSNCVASETCIPFPPNVPFHSSVRFFSFPPIPSAEVSENAAPHCKTTRMLPPIARRRECSLLF